MGDRRIILLDGGDADDLMRHGADYYAICS